MYRKENKKMLKILFFIIGIVLSFSSIHDLYPDVKEDLLKGLITDGITADLRNPEYSEGVLKTECGGVINGPDIRIQAMYIEYTRKVIDSQVYATVYAEGKLLIEYGPYTFVGDSLEYDFQEKRGTVFNGKSGVDPWYFGGEQIDLLPNKTVVVRKGFITTSEKCDPDWAILTNSAQITCDKIVTAKGIYLHYNKVPLLWVPCFKANLDWILDSPIRYRFRWGGPQGPRIGMIYEAFVLENLEAFLRFDYRFQRGPGGGIETAYESPDGNETFHTINYIANDSSIDDPNEKTRYRVEGIYSNYRDDGRFTIDLTYDKLSDKDMASDYYDRSFDLKTAEHTQLSIRRQWDQCSITNFFTRVRINDFQTINQELPEVAASMRPYVLGSTGLIWEQLAKMGYFDFKYSDDVEHVHDYHSSRIELRNRLYRNFKTNYLVATPEAKGVLIYYGSSPQHEPRSLLVGSFGGEIKTDLYKHYSNTKHIIEPYLLYQYITTPTVSPNNHFMFDIEDGWFTLNTLRIGLRNLIYTKRAPQCVTRNLTGDIYTYIFFDNNTQLESVPKIYGDFVWDALPCLRYSLHSAWDIERSILDHVNFRTDWTLSADFAIAAEYRHRSPYAWRKMDPYNFILESFHTENELFHSLVSDRRDTLLCHTFYRFHPDWTCEFQLRHGWNRRNEPAYMEYQLDLVTTLRSKWNIRLSYQYREYDHTLTFYFSLGQ
jgi:hypothetical protein